MERLLKTAHIGRFKPLCDFDWNWPKRCDRAAIDALMTLDFLGDATNVVLIGPNGVGKSTLARNIAHQALIHGHTVLFTSAGQLLGDLCALDSNSALCKFAGNSDPLGAIFATKPYPLWRCASVLSLTLFGREGEWGMVGVELIGEIRRAYFERRRPIKEIVRTQ